MNSQIAAMIQRITEQYLTETCTLQKRVQQTNAVGVAIETFENTETLACRIITETAGGRGIAQEMAGRETLTDAYRIVLPAGTSIGDDYRVVSGGYTYEVVGILDQRTDGNDVQVRARRMR